MIATVENKKALIPAKAESDNKVSNTLIPTFPHKIVANKKLESFLNAKTFLAALFPLLDSTSSCKRLSENKAIFKPENIADCDIHKAMAIQVIVISNDMFLPS